MRFPCAMCNPQSHSYWPPKRALSQQSATGGGPDHDTYFLSVLEAAGPGARLSSLRLALRHLFTVSTHELPVYAEGMREVWCLFPFL